jgi:hypothetical protein
MKRALKKQQQVEFNLCAECMKLAKGNDNIGKKFKKNNRTYYTKKAGALKDRKKGDVIYYDAFAEGYYIVPVKKRSFWSRI